MAMLVGLLVVVLAATPAAAQDVDALIFSVTEETRLSATSEAATATTFTIPPSVTSSSVGAGVRTLLLGQACVERLTGQIIPFCDVQLAHAAIPFSGGHDHDDSNRPKGAFNPASGNTGPSGILVTPYTAPEVSGVINAQLTGVTADGRVVTPSTFTIGVRIDGLESLPPGVNYLLVGGFGQPNVTSRHVANHFGTPSFNTSLRTLADSYAQTFPGRRLLYNDMSLVEGGLFDIGNNWRPEHFEHRFGINVDVDVTTVPGQDRNSFRQLIRDSGIRGTIVEHGRHWHLRQ